ncbi:MAG: WbqC family protein [Candidatus Omnitrophica bacterium]|nr:WbqC family protein [Candidatus Omnitrophota bacterium]
MSKSDLLVFLDDEGIPIEFHDYKHPEYMQVYKPFIPYVSALDLWFNCGKDSLRIINGE